MFPENPEKIDPGFMLYLNKEQQQPTMLDLHDPEAVRASGMRRDGTVYVIAHGYLESGYKPWMARMRRALFERDASATVILIDWQGGSSPPYAQAVANIRLVGAMVGHLLEMVAQHHLQGADGIHLIGHSLGAHLSAYAGYALQRDFNLTVGRISGLDPAEPHFARAAAPVRLEPSAARFVDVVHTDASAFIRGGLGIIERVGHVDFYANGGTDQPGCDAGVAHYIDAERGSFFRGVRMFLGCNHVRSYQYYTESILKGGCRFNAIECDSYVDLKEGRCFGCRQRTCLEFGFDSAAGYDRLLHEGRIRRGQRLLLYYMTSDHPPFCSE